MPPVQPCTERVENGENEVENIGADFRHIRRIAGENLVQNIEKNNDAGSKARKKHGFMLFGRSARAWPINPAMSSKTGTSIAPATDSTGIEELK